MNARRNLALRDYAALYSWSIEQPEQFWSELAHFADVRADWGDGPVIEHPERMPGARFFPAARLNFADNLLRFRDDQPAVAFTNERGMEQRLTYRQLCEEVARIAAGLKDAGVGSGDRVAGYLPNLPHALIAMLATASLGGIWSSCSPTSACRACSIASVRSNRRCFHRRRILLQRQDARLAGADRRGGPAMPGLRRIVVIAYLSQSPRLEQLGPAHAYATHWAAFGQRGAPLQFTPLPFDHPLYILFSSGTTGVPKCIVHGAGGTLLQHQKEHLLHVDLKRGDQMFYFTTCGWMMWNWLASALAAGATLVLYDGNPFHPDPGVLWRMAVRERVTIFGTSAKYLSALEKNGYTPARQVD
ncbi:acetoacetyl-CoA synthase, partial [mine drainage metagenome]